MRKVLLAGGLVLMLGGEAIAVDPATASVQPDRRLALGLSVALPGAGQLYEGDHLKGSLYMGGYAAAYGLAWVGGQNHDPLLTLTGVTLLGLVTLASPVDLWFSKPPEDTR